MLMLFQYNWHVRNEWFEWCKQVSEEELLRDRTGGVGSMMKTLYHIVDVEYSWIQVLQGKPDIEEAFEKYDSLHKIIDLSNDYHTEVKEYLDNWTGEMESELDLRFNKFKKGEVLRHIIAHEIHHIGQLSIWARGLDLKPVSANLIGKDLLSPSK